MLTCLQPPLFRIFWQNTPPRASCTAYPLYLSLTSPRCTCFFSSMTSQCCLFLWNTMNVPKIHT